MTPHAAPSGVTPPTQPHNPRSWAEQNRSIVGTLGAVLLSLIAAGSGHLVELLKMVLDHGWKAVLLISAAAICAIIVGFVSSVKATIEPVIRTLAGLAEHSGREDAAHVEQAATNVEFRAIMLRLSTSLERLESAFDRYFSGLPAPKSADTQPPRMPRL